MALIRRMSMTRLLLYRKRHLGVDAKTCFCARRAGIAAAIRGAAAFATLALFALHPAAASGRAAAKSSNDARPAYDLKALNDAAEACGADPAILHVEASVPTHPRNLVGFLLSQRSPAKLVAPLRPGAWRANPEDYEALSHYNPDLIMQCSSYQSFANANGRVPRSSRELYDFTKVWLNQYRAIAPRLIVEMQNEPDLGDGTIEEKEAIAFSNYLAIYRASREVGSAVALTGPNTSVPDMRWITDFVEFCLARSCAVNYLSWHFATPIETRAAIERVRAEVISNPRYRPLGIKGIIISEFTVEEEATDPAANLSHFAMMERMGVYAAMKACWAGNCFGRTLDGLLDEHLEPRSVWHLWRFYAAGLAKRVASTSSDPAVPIVASRSGEAALHILIANDGRNSANRAIDLHVDGLPRRDRGGAQRLEVVLEDMSAGEGLTPRLRAVVEVSSTTRLCLQALPPHVAARLRLSMPATP